MPRGAKPAKVKAKAKRPLVRSQAPKREAARVHELEKRLAEAHEQRTATSDILRVISQSQTDVQPVFNAIASSARRLLGGHSVSVSRVVRDELHLMAFNTTSAATDALLQSTYPMRLDRVPLFARVMRERTTATVTDIDTNVDVTERMREVGRARGFRSFVWTPMVRDDVVIGIIAVTRREPGAFTDSDVALLQTFADQAVIAIENVRLFTDLEHKNKALTQSLEQQTATGEILTAISASPTDVHPVFDAIVESAVRLCGARYGAVFRYDGELLHLAAHHNFSEAGLAGTHEQYPMRPSRAHISGRSILAGATVQIPDVALDAEYGSALATHLGFRSLLAVPILRGDAAIGSIVIYRTESGPFADKQVGLLQTFADQAVIAIENVRLFKELEARNRDLTEALDQQTATSEILRTITHTQTDTQPVFETIVRSAARLCRAANAAVFLTEGRMLYEPANYGSSPEALAATRARFPRPLDTDTTAGMAILTRTVVHVPDIEEPSAIEHVRQSGRLLGFRSVVTVPMLREGEAVGAILVTRREPGPFSDAALELLKTFADQAVIAVENVRLFTELEARTAALTRSVDQLTALGEVGRAVSSSLDLETVLTTIVARAVQLSGLDGGVMFEYDEAAEAFVQRVATETGGPLAEARRATQIRKGEGALGQTAITLEPVQVPDITVAGAYESRLRENLIESGIRAVLAVPMVREGQLIGCLVVSRNRPGEFPAETIELLRTFATQSALAIQNARLFQEIAAKSRQLEVASQHKSEFLANMSHELRTPLNAVIGFSEVLTERMFGELNEKQDEYVRDIYASGTHLLSLINDILDLSKVEAGRMELELADFHLPQAIENAVVLVRERALRRGITLEQSIDPHLGEVQGDERKIKQVLLNLLSNAIKFTPEGGRVGVRAEPVDEHVQVAVSDTGVGIAPEDHEAVFEEFRQVGTADKKVEGTGLGLALSRKFIELHGGRIWVKSQVGAGSTFTFTLPLTTDQQRHPLS
jgi:signal transduction histidine kinase